MYHLPVMLNECIEGLNIQPNGTYVDLTFGGGGHSREILKHLNEKGKLIAFDQDFDAVKNIPDDKRLMFVNHNFKYTYQFLDFLKVLPVDGILADLGISSYQIDEPSKGFAHRFDANLDMRMDKNSSKSAADIINNYDENSLKKVFRDYGEINNAYKLVEAIFSARKIEKINTINQFKEAISNIVPKKEESKYLSQVFQALRIEVNQEVEVLKKMLSQLHSCIKTNGRIVIMSYHSLEDRLVKNLIQTGNVEGVLEKDNFGKSTPYFKAINKKIITPTEKEISENKRARSAKLRIAEKI